MKKQIVVSDFGNQKPIPDKIDCASSEDEHHPVIDEDSAIENK